jgi:lysozyme family protein
MAKIDLLLPFILKHEGKFVNDPTDKGGATNMGVTLTTWRSCGYDKDGDGDVDVSDLKLLTAEDVRDKVLKPMYWDRWRADLINDQKIANIVVDWTYNSGAWGVKIPQRVLGVDVDGSVGQKTILAINRHSNPEQLLDSLYKARIDFINGIVTHSVAEYKKEKPDATEKDLLKYTQKRFLKGWLNRVEALKKL